MSDGRLSSPLLSSFLQVSFSVVRRSCRHGVLPYLFLQHALQRLLRLTVWERRQVVVICGQLEQPLRADLCHRTDICSRRKHEFIEQNPLRLRIETTRRVQRYRLIRRRKVMMPVSGSASPRDTTGIIPDCP